MYEPMHFAGAEEVRDHLGDSKPGGGKVSERLLIVLCHAHECVLAL